jgi:hypothetical protein
MIRHLMLEQSAHAIHVYRSWKAPKLSIERVPLEIYEVFTVAIRTGI